MRYVVKRMWTYEVSLHLLNLYFDGAQGLAKELALLLGRYRGGHEGPAGRWQTGPVVHSNPRMLFGSSLAASKNGNTCRIVLSLASPRRRKDSFRQNN